MAIGKHVTKIGRLSTIYVSGEIVPIILGLLLLPIFTHYLVPEQLGIIRLSLQITQSMAIFIQLGLAASLKSYYFRVEPNLQSTLVKTVFWGQVVLGILLCSLFSIAGFWLAELFLPNLPLAPQKTLFLWLMIVWGCFFICIIRFSKMTSQLRERAGISVAITSSRYIVQDCLGVVAVVWLGWQGFGRQSTIFAGAVIAAAISIWLIRGFAKGVFDINLFKINLKTGLTFVPHSFAGILVLALNVWMVSKMISAAAIGIYGIAIQFAQSIQLPLLSFGNAAYPTFARLMSEGTEKAKQQQSRLYTLAITGIGVLALSILFFAPLAIDILVDLAYHEAKTILPILVLAWIFQGLYWVVSNIVFYFGGGLWLTAASISSMIVNVILTLILIPFYGVHGAAVAMVGCFLVRFIVVLVIAQKKYPLPWQSKIIFCVLGGMFVMALLNFWISQNLPFILAIVMKLIMLGMTVPLALVCKAVNIKELIALKIIIIGKLSALKKHKMNS